MVNVWKEKYLCVFQKGKFLSSEDGACLDYDLNGRSAGISRGVFAADFE